MMHAINSGNMAISDEDKAKVESLLEKKGLQLGTGTSGWHGGEIWLVDTSKPISGWKPIAMKKI
jgi:hypothetical protein